MKLINILLVVPALAACGGVVDLPVVQDVDVFVVGGGVAAVSAACAAKAAGASVFLAAPRPQLGEDICGKLRLRREPGDDERHALYAAIFAPDLAPRELAPYTYSYENPPTSGVDDSACTRLKDGRCVNLAKDGVGFDDSVFVRVDLGSVQEVSGVEVDYFSRGKPAAKWRKVPKDLHNTIRIGVQTSEDGRKWSRWHVQSSRSRGSQGEQFAFTANFTERCRYLRVKAVKGESCNRQVLGEIKVFKPAGAGEPLAAYTTPLRVKTSLDRALLEADIPYLTGCAATDILLDSSGRPAGAVIANRSGRQAVKAKVVIDATERGWLASRAGAAARPFPAGDHEFARIVLSGAAPKSPKVRAEELPGRVPVAIRDVSPRGFPDSFDAVYRVCRMKIAMPDGTARSFAAAEQTARDLTFDPLLVKAADTLLFVPPDSFLCASPASGEWKGADAAPLGAFRPKGLQNVFVLGPRADVPRAWVPAMTRLGASAKLGERIGGSAAAAAHAWSAAPLAQAPRRSAAQEGPRACDERRRLAEYHCNTNGIVAVDDPVPPAIAECDVFVAGAGTGGAPAGIAAARAGAKTIVCEFLYNLGGVQTEGKVPGYYFGNCVGFTKEIDRGVVATAAIRVQAKAEWYRRECRRAGAEVLCGTFAEGVVMDGAAVVGVIVVMPDGSRSTVGCRAAVDATGNAVLAAAAGAEHEFIDGSELSVQGVGMPRSAPGMSGSNCDIGFVDESDASDLFYFALRSRFSLEPSCWDQGPIVDSRERRRIIGDFRIRPADILCFRAYPDTIARAYSNFDTHGQTTAPEFFLAGPAQKPLYVNIPYRALLPKGIDGLVATGLGISAHRDAMPVLRMQPDIQNEGYAAGYACALAAAKGVPPRAINVKTLQAHLAQIGNIPPQELEARDSFPLPDSAFEEAVASLPDGFRGLEVLMTDPPRAVRHLEKAFASADASDKLPYAHALAMLGSPVGSGTLVEKLKSSKWDEGWNFKGMSQFGRSVSDVDSLLIALGNCRAAAAADPAMALASQLTEKSEYSHFRAVARALEGAGDRRAVPVLVKLLRAPGIGGHSIAPGRIPPPIKGHDNAVGNHERSLVLRELCLARALYRLGDDDSGLGRRTLEAYSRDPRRAYATHARLVLATHLQ